ncbi:MAG: 30S ribosomal protein S1 [Deltaproteobacteria bacterium]|nr:30S ribosomal protein S1 [Deltaproteobacteria bacterium]MBI2227790.1 30S ribosomal protein S1 [Deltaproteobacteria bacterium]MBI2366150.1 30S ribosomal protein S1 [Deltaproteobacteria bacterium]MBI2531255.1 30S ribosomal protein S1 [Deltaproteobacteria bacterium]
MAQEERKTGATEFETMFEESLRTVKPGGVVKGRVVGITSTHVLIDVGYKSEGQTPIQEFTDHQGNLQVKVGDEVDVYFDSSESENGGIVLSRQRAENIKVWEDIEKSFNEGTGIEGRIIGKIKGGFKVDVGVMGFLPGSHVDIRPSRNLDKFIGTTDRFVVLKFNRARGNVVLSRRALLEKERDGLKQDILKILEEGVILEGMVKNITGYGAFVDLGGIDGILHISDMSWGRISHPSEVVHVGDKLQVVVLKFDAEKERISLGMKQLTPDPWNTVAAKYPAGSRVQGKVISIMDYGAFVELESGIEGLIHISEMSWSRKIAHPSKILQVGQQVEVVVLNVDPGHRRISLGLKQVMANPWEAAKEKYPVGSIIKGPVRNITDFGIFIGIEEGIDGLAHVSDLHWTKKIKHPSELFKKGDIVEARVLGINVENERFSLGVKQMATDPWKIIAERYPVGSKIKGQVTSVPDFGVFVRIEEGVEGLVHVSQLSTERVDKPSSLYKVGDDIEAEVINLDPNERKIGLSVKALRKSEERQEMENYLKREKEGGRFSFEKLLNDELRLDRDESKTKG